MPAQDRFAIVTLSNEISNYELTVVGVQEGRWEGSGTKLASECIFFYGKGIENHELPTRILCVGKSHQQLRGLSLLVVGHPH
jgi:hypothetical protein